jgi:hypothetical protein
MSPNTQKKLLFSQLFLFLPLIIFAQSNRTQSVALVPFWGPDEQFIQEFGEELYKSVNGMQGYRSIVIDMTNLPDDVPEGGFPPYICPSPSLIKTNPIALTGELSTDPDDDEFWHLRLYLWEMADTRLVFSDELTAYDREECAAGLPGMLDWLFSWLKRGGKGAGGAGDGEGDLSNQFNGRQVFITTSMPLQWMYLGLRFGATPLRLQNAPQWEGITNPATTYVENRFETINGALSFSLALFPESVPFFSRFVVQVEGIFNYDFEPDPKLNSQSPSTMTISPAALLKFQVYRHGSMLVSVFGGAYTNFALDDKIAYGSLVPIGWITGLSFGGKLEPIPGIFFIDMRYCNDEFNTYVRKDDEAYRRKAVSISVGYEFGFITKK